MTRSNPSGIAKQLGGLMLMNLAGPLNKHLRNWSLLRNKAHVKGRHESRAHFHRNHYVRRSVIALLISWRIKKQVRLNREAVNLAVILHKAKERVLTVLH